MIDYSAAARERVNATSGEAPVYLLEIEHADLAAPVRVVNDTEDLVHLGHTFVALRFAVSLPSERDKQTPTVRLGMDNVGRELTSWIEASAGGRGATVRLIQVWRDAPDVVEHEITLDMGSVELDHAWVSAVVGFDDLLNRPGLPTVYDPDTAPGVF